jgi:GTPase Era involved in 16S rRNA processing
MISNSINPRFILFYGKTRLGKSTTLNKLIKGNLDSWKFINKKPFNSTDSINSVTKGCDIFGPIKIKELIKRHNIKDLLIEEDFDVFFCDTEGIESLDSIQKTTITGILTLLQVCNISVFMIHKFCSGNDFKEIYSQIQLSKILPKNLVANPRITLYVSSIFIGNNNQKDDEESINEEDEEELDYKNVKEKYKESEKFQKQKIFEEFKKNILI